MRKLLLILSFAVALFVFHAEAGEKEYRKILEKHDVPVAVRQYIGWENAASFWDALTYQNPRLRKLFEDINKKKGAEKEAMRNVNRLSICNAATDPDIIHSWDSIFRVIRDEMGLSEEQCSVHLYNDDTMNAGTGLTVDHKFMIVVNGGMIDVIGSDYDLLLAVLAHEMGHGMLFHHLDSEYAVAKKKRKDKIIAGVAAGLGAVGAAADVYFATKGVPSSGADWGGQIAELGNKLEKSEWLFRYKYSRGNEFEADLVGYRFMDQIAGRGDKYIELLELIGRNSPIDMYSSEDSDHPSIPERIGLLEYASQHPEIVNEVDKKIISGIEKSERKKTTKEHDDIYN